MEASRLCVLFVVVKRVFFKGVCLWEFVQGGMFKGVFLGGGCFLLLGVACLDRPPSCRGAGRGQHQDKRNSQQLY